MRQPSSWPEGTVVSLRLTDTRFMLAQMRQNHLLQFVGIHRADAQWPVLDLSQVPTLHFSFVAEQRLNPLVAAVLPASTVRPSQQPVQRLMLSAVLGNGQPHSADLVELTAELSSVGARVVKAALRLPDDLALIHRHELTGMVGNPEKLRARLLRYCTTGVNWDESKHFLFDGLQPPAPG